MAPKTLDHNIVEYDAARGATDHEYAQAVTKTPSFLVYDSSFHDVLGKEPNLTLIEERDYQFAHEAGLYIKSTDSEYFTANYQTCAPIDLYSINCTTHKIKKESYPDVHNANGACNYPSDKILYCSQGTQTQPSGLVLVDPVSGTSKTLITNYYGRPFNSVNDVVVHHLHSNEIWFTDPTYGYEQAFRPQPQLPSQIYRFNPTTNQIWCVADGFAQCNGLCFSPDYKLMYVTDTGAIQAHEGPGDGHQVSFRPRLPSTIYVFDVVDRVGLANRRMFAFCDTGVPDGIKCDEVGNVYSGCGDGVHVWNKEGTLIGKILVGGTVANFNFAKDGSMWMFGEKRLYLAKLKAKGALVRVECE